MPPCSSGSDTLTPVKPPIGSASSRIMAISTPVPSLDAACGPGAMPQMRLRRRRTVLSATQPR
jgi:hypothetical protein